MRGGLREIPVRLFEQGHFPENLAPPPRIRMGLEPGLGFDQMPQGLRKFVAAPFDRRHFAKQPRHPPGAMMTSRPLESMPAFEQAVLQIPRARGEDPIAPL